MDKIKSLFAGLVDGVKGFWTGKARPFFAGTAAGAADLWKNRIVPGAAGFFSKPRNLIICGGAAAAVILAVVLTLLYVNVWSWVDNITITMPEDVYAASVASPSDAPAVSETDAVSGADVISGSDAVSVSDVPAVQDAPAAEPVSAADVLVSGSDVSSSDAQPEQSEPVSVVLRMKKGSTVADALEQANIVLDESLSIDTPVETELVSDMVISIYRMKFTSIIVDGGRVDHYTDAATVGELLEECGIVLNEQDRISCDLQTSVENNMVIEIARVVVVDEVKSEPVPFSSERRENASVLEGESKVITAGVDGTKDVTYRSVYVDGILESSEIVQEVITLEPVTEVIEVGTKRTTTTTRKTKPARYVVSKEKVYDCDGSGHGYYIITYSDGTVEYKDF